MFIDTSLGECISSRDFLCEESSIKERLLVEKETASSLGPWARKPSGSAYLRKQLKPVQGLITSIKSWE
jgi:hypothetical protein